MFDFIISKISSDGGDFPCIIEIALFGLSSLEITVLPDLLDKMQTFALIEGPHNKFSCPTSFEITVLPTLLDKVRIFSHMRGLHRELSCRTYFEITALLDLLDKTRTFPLI